MRDARDILYRVSNGGALHRDAAARMRAGRLGEYNRARARAHMLRSASLCVCVCVCVYRCMMRRYTRFRSEQDDKSSACRVSVGPKRAEDGRMIAAGSERSLAIARACCEIHLEERDDSRSRANLNAPPYIPGGCYFSDPGRARACGIRLGANDVALQNTS